MSMTHNQQFRQLCENVRKTHPTPLLGCISDAPLTQPRVLQAHGCFGHIITQSITHSETRDLWYNCRNKTELNGLLYVIDRLPEGITECVSINMTAEEGLSSSSFQPIIPAKRRRNCYRIDKDQMVIEVTRGRSEVYDILTHLTFLYIEADKICNRVYISSSKQTIREWQKIEATATSTKTVGKNELESTMAYLAQLLECTYNEATDFYNRFQTPNNPYRFIRLIYHMVRVAINERSNGNKRVITFSAMLRDQIGHHIHGERWANQLYKALTTQTR
ncbi:MAG: hypothetical protein CM15mP83_1330 [Flavobacteriaceae bacterium]|nr:MAG: hypothetical protein CM15mP83_1330 [Flavobacteriaceae bacterium]